ncbi:MAG TPA: GAF domain-containing protein, partial [Bradyrhizobium sp.]|uniref:GAF domain-containing protein n=1 Tax=Bradyrhizobium sp. TaxID=376 RepID=UPI002D80C217
MIDKLAEGPQQVINDLQRRLDESLAQQAATADVLRVIGRSSFDLHAVLETLINSAVKLCGANRGAIFLRDGEVYPLRAVSSASPEFLQYWAANPPRAGRGSATSRVIASGKVEVIPDVLADPEMQMPATSLNRIRGTLGVPLLRDNKVEGVMVLTRPEPGPFTQSQIDLVQTFADQAMIAIENARLFDEVQAKSADLHESLQHQTATAEVLEVISRSPRELDPVFQTILASASDICAAQFGNLFVLQKDGGLHCASTFNLPSAFAETFSRQAVIYPPPIDPLGRVIATRQLVHVTDVKQEPAYVTGFRPFMELVELGGAKTILLVPMLKEDLLVGVIAIFRQTVHSFSDKQIELVTSFANQAVIAIENTRLFNETQDALARQTASADILRVISRSQTDVQPVFDAIVRTAVRLIGCDRAFFMRVDGQTYTPVAGVNRDGPVVLGPRQPIDPAANFPSRAIATKQMLHLPDWSLIELPEYERTIRELHGARSSLLMPLLRGDDCIGLLALVASQPNAFSATGIALAESFRDQALIAIENARLFSETQEALERQTATADILKVIASSPSDVQPVFEAIATRANGLVGGFSATVFRFIDGMAHLMAFTPTTPEADDVLKSTFPSPVESFAPFQMARDGEVTQVPDTESLTDEILEIARARGFRSMLFAPLMNKGASIGLIAVTRLQTGAFSDHHVQLLRTFADQAVIAIENARMFDEVQARTHDLSEALQFQTATSDVLKVISSSPDTLQPVLDVIVETSRHLCSAVTSSIFLLRDGRFHIAALSGATPEYLEFLQANPIAPEQRGSSTARAAREKRTVHIPDISADPEFGQGHMAVGHRRALLSVPLMREGVAIGMITMTQPYLTPFTERQIEVVQTFAEQAVIAISNVRLFEQVQERTRELSLSLDELRTAQDRLVQTEKLASLGQLTAGIAHEIKNPLNFVNNFSALSGELIDELNDLLGSAALDDKTREEIDELTAMLKGNLDKVVQHGKRADSIVKNMLLHSREGTGDRRAADINTIVEESLNLAYHGARAEKSGFNITLQRDLDPSAGVIDLYPQEITRVFLNLISNGFYAANKRKEAGDDGFEPLLRATTKNLGNKVEIRIRDNGTGIPAEV